MKLSCGILPYKIENGKIKVYLSHFGGPFWKNKKRSWGIIKGEAEDKEDCLKTAKREFFEETGKKIEGDFIDLGETKTSNKIIHIFAIEKDLDTDIKSNLVKLEYKGKLFEFPEIDEVKWFNLEEAKEKIVKSQEVFLERLDFVLKLSEKNVRKGWENNIKEVLSENQNIKDEGILQDWLDEDLKEWD